MSTDDHDDSDAYVRTTNGYVGDAETLLQIGDSRTLYSALSAGSMRTDSLIEPTRSAASLMPSRVRSASASRAVTLWVRRRTISESAMNTGMVAIMTAASSGAHLTKYSNKFKI